MWFQGKHIIAKSHKYKKGIFLNSDTKQCQNISGEKGETWQATWLLTGKAQYLDVSFVRVL